jgi:hypothetical protein
MIFPPVGTIKEEHQIQNLLVYPRYPSSKWKVFHARNLYILAIKQNVNTMEQELINWHGQIMSYFHQHYAILPCLGKDKIYNVKKTLKFTTVPIPSS